MRPRASLAARLLLSAFLVPAVLSGPASLAAEKEPAALPEQPREKRPEKKSAPRPEEGPQTLPEKIDRLIRELGHAKYSVREKAQQELANLGFEAYDALTAAAHHDDLEIATRAKYLLRLIPAQWSMEGEPEEVRRYLTYYQSEDQEVRIAVLKELARLPGGIGVPALCRLVRFEKSTLWSKHAGIVLLNWEPPDKARRARWTKALREHLGESARPAARWLRTYLQFRDDPRAGSARWGELVEREQTALRRLPEHSGPRIVAALMYYAAMAQAEAGEGDAAEEAARQARQFTPVRNTTRLSAREDMAGALRRRGKLRWAELEYRQVMDAGLPFPKVRAGLTLSEMLHDAGEEAPAAEALAQVLKIEKKALDAILNRIDRKAGEIRARMIYFRACRAAEQGHPAEQRKLLDEALRHDPAELDSLIARYQLPDVEPEYREKTLELIGEAAAALRQAIDEARDDPRYHNQLAWLVGNTEGDLDEALRCARRAVELAPETSAYQDTLAHVYFARGELEKAVEHQTRAAELEPHSGLIAEKLVVFRKALEASRAKQEPKPDEKPAGAETAPKPPSEKRPPKAESPAPE